MSIAALVTSPLLKTALELVLPIVHDVAGGGRTADALVSKIQLKSLEVDGKKIAAQQQILKAELEGNTLQRNWRPIAMFVFMALLVYQVVVVSALNAIFGADTVPQDAQLVYKIIDVILYGMGGYILGRSGEKIARTIVDGKAERQIREQEEDGLKPRPVPEGAQVVEAPFMRSDR